MRFDVIVLPKAVSAVRRIIRWLEKRSVPGARAWRTKWLDTVDRLKDTADGCGLAPEDESLDETARQILFKTRRGRNYRALFVIREKIVYVFAVRGPGQDILHPDEIKLPEDD